MESASEDVKSAATGGAFISARLRNPADEIAARGQGTGDVIGGICAIVATVLLLVVTALLYINWGAIQSA